MNEHPAESRAHGSRRLVSGVEATDLALAALSWSLAGCALVMSIWVAMPWPALLALMLLLVSLVVRQAFSGSRAPALMNAIDRAALVWTATFLCSLLLVGKGGGFQRCLSYYHAVLAWLMAGAMAITFRLPSPGGRPWWRINSVLWAFFGCVLWLATSYAENRRGAFYLGILFTLALGVLSKRWFRFPYAAILCVNTLILLLVGLPLTDLFLRLRPAPDTRPETLMRYCRYNEARKDRAAFERWWHYLWDQWDVLFDKIVIKDPAAAEPFRLKPNSYGTLVQSRISINSRGFRGKEIIEPKENAYRIVALGESTTFGLTIRAEDKPWPELLEQVIRERLHPRRPVEMINAGVPGATLPQNLHRLAREILPLKPDMIICYHGFNGFPLLDEALPPSHGPRPPHYQERPLRILADCEYRLKLRRYKHDQTARLFLNPPRFRDVLSTPYADAYRELIQMAQTNSIRLVLANFSMAANGKSDPQVIDFFRAHNPATFFQIQANQAHALLVQTLAEQHPEVGFVDTHPGLDGNYQMFLDLVHFTQEGDRRLAETFFVSLRKLLENELAEPAPNTP